MHDQRKTSYAETMDFVPTPPWATRAFLSTFPEVQINGSDVLEPGVGRGDLARVLQEAGARVTGLDIVDRGFPNTIVADYNSYEPPVSFEWVVMNPPFTFGESFLRNAMRHSTKGVVLHIRTTWLNGVGRWNEFFQPGHLTDVVMHAKNVSATQSKVIRRGSNQFNHSWLVFEKAKRGRPIGFRFIPADAQDTYERATDYD